MALKWSLLSGLSFNMVLLINLLFVIFYQVGEDQTINLQYAEAELAVELLGIVQAFISFIVMISYILEYHGRFYQQYLETY